MLKFAATAAVLSVLAACGGSGKEDPPANRLPVADAGPDQSVFRNVLTTLSGVASSDPDSNALAYRWTQTGGASVNLSSATAASPTFNAPTAIGDLTFTLTVNDGKADSAADTVIVHVGNRPPVAAAGPDMSVEAGVLATLDGTTSSDADGDTLTYQWVQLSGATVTLTSVAPGKVRFAAPSAPGSLSFGLIVNDGSASSVQDVVDVAVVPNSSNMRPVAFAGSNQQWGRGAMVALYGSGHDPDGSRLTFRWTQSAGPAVVLDDPTSMYPSFTAPSTVTDLRFKLIVSDGVLESAADEVVVSIINLEPYVSTAELLPGNAARTTDDLHFAVTAVDPDGDPVTITYVWSLNGAVVSTQTGNVFPASLTTRNDVVAVRATVSDGTASVPVEATTTIVDSPAVITGTPPTTASYGSTISFTLNATDPDGDNVSTFEIAHGPAGMSVSPTGAVTWTIDGPLFDQVQDFQWGVRVAGDAQSLLTGTIRVTDVSRAQMLRRAGGGVPALQSSLRIADLDNDGDLEAIVATRTGLYELERVGSGYQEVWAYPFAFSPRMSLARAVAVGNVDADPRKEIFVAEGEVLAKLDGATRRVTAQYFLPPSSPGYPPGAGYGSCLALELADLDNDGQQELICLASPDYYSSSASRILVLRASDLSLLWSVNVPNAGNSLTVANVDNDPALEVITNMGFVFDGVTQQNEWAYGPTFGGAVAAGDLDGDGVAEILGTIRPGTGTDRLVRAYDARNRSVRWTIDLYPGSPYYSVDQDVITVANIQGDARPEILIGDGSYDAYIHAIGFNTGTAQLEELWKLDTPDYGVTAITAGDIDDDGEIEVVWGTGNSQQSLLVAGTAPTPDIEWSNATELRLDGYFSGARLFHPTPGVVRLGFMVPHTSDVSSGARAIALDPANGRLTFSSAPASYQNVAPLDVADYDGDGVDELFVGAGDYTNQTRVLDFAADSVEWLPPGYGTPVAITHGDLNADGHADLVAISAEGKVFALDPYHQTQIWYSDTFAVNGSPAGGGVDIQLEDLDGDGDLEIIAAFNSAVIVLEKPLFGYSYAVKKSATVNTQDLLVADTNSDGRFEIYVLGGYYSPTLTRFDSALQTRSEIQFQEGMSSLHLEKSASARKNLLIAKGGGYASDSFSELRAIDPISGAEVWRSPHLAGYVPINSLEYVDWNSDGKPEIVFGTTVAMYLTR